MTSDQLTNIAKSLDNAAHQITSTAQISDTNKLTIDEAYQVQAQSLSNRYSRGEKLVGVKMGFTSYAKMKQMGVNDMIFGRLTDKMTYPDGGELKKADYIHPRIEPEIAFLVSKDIDTVLTLENAKEYIDGIAIALEVIDSRYQNFKFSLEDVVADNCSSAAYVIGNWMPETTVIQDLRMSMIMDETVVSTGNSNDILGNPWESLVAASRLAIQYNEPLKAGYIVLAGAATAAVHIEAGKTVLAHGEGIGSVSVHIID